MKQTALFLVFFLLAGCAVNSEGSGWFLYRMGFYSDALEDWHKAAEAGDGGAAFRLGTAYLDGVVVKRNPVEGLKWIKLGVKLGDSRAELELGSVYECVSSECIKFGVKRSFHKAAQLYLAAARQGEAVAQYNIATMFEDGKGIQKNFVEAYKFYSLAIENDFATFANPARDKLAYKMSRAQIELARLRVKAFRSKDHTGIGGI